MLQAKRINELVPAEFLGGFADADEMGEGGSRGGGAGTRAWIFSRRASGPAYTAQYPDVIRLKSEIAALERVPKTTAAVGEEFRILDPAVPARNAVAPQRRLFILIGLGLGLGAAAAAVMVADQLDGSFHSLEELRAFSKLPVLVTIPLIGATSPDRPRLWLRAAPIAIGLVLVVLVSYHLASGNDQLAFLFSRGTP